MNSILKVLVLALMLVIGSVQAADGPTTFQSLWASCKGWLGRARSTKATPAAPEVAAKAAATEAEVAKLSERLNVIQDEDRLSLLPALIKDLTGTAGYQLLENPSKMRKLFYLLDQNLQVFSDEKDHKYRPETLDVLELVLGYMGHQEIEPGASKDVLRRKLLERRAVAEHGLNYAKAAGSVAPNLEKEIKRIDRLLTGIDDTVGP